MADAATATGVPECIEEPRGRGDLRARQENGAVQWYIPAMRAYNREGDSDLGEMVVDIGERRHREEKAVTESAFPPCQLLRLANFRGWHWNIPENSFSFSDKLCRTFGVPARRTYEDYLQLVHPDDRVRVDQTIRAALARGTSFEFEQRIVRPDGAARYLANWGEIGIGADGDAVWVLGICRDVTDRWKMTRSHHETEERMRLLVANVKDYAIFMLSPSGHISSWNEGARRIKGYADDEVLGRHFSCFYTSEAREAGIPDRELSRAARYGRTEDEGWRIRKDGSHFWASVVITALFDETGQLLGFGKVTRDLTERKLNEERREAYAKRLHDLSQRLIEVHEEERRRLASEIHNDLGQSLTALKLRLEQIQSEKPRDGSGSLAGCVELVEQITNQIRDLSLDLNPLILHDLGLEETLRSHLRAQLENSGIKPKLLFDNVPRHLPENVATACFRISQEAVTNALRHSGASRLSLSVVANPGTLELTIRDDGAGFDVREAEGVSSKGPRFGLLHMRERTTVLGGTFDIDTGLDRGTTVHAVFPLRGGGGSEWNGAQWSP